jgi:dipeptidyl aminopeptidase/acylaminoacyl peptidase
MSEARIAPYGAWKSPVTSDLIVAGTISLGQVRLDGDDIYWLEMRPSEGGRYRVVRRTPDGAQAEVTPATFNVRTRVHEYGGGAYAVHDGVVYFSNFEDQRLYRQLVGSEPEPITPQIAWRYADGVVDSGRNRLICVREDHTLGQEAVNTLVSLPLDGHGEQQVLVFGNDFYASPRLSPDGTRLAWLTWNHPNMPWDGTELWMAQLQPDGSLSKAVLVAGGPNESIFQPEWSPEGILHFVSDRTGWWNLYRWQSEQIEPLYPMEAEFGVPQWVFGMHTYAFASPTQIICLYEQAGIWKLASLDTTSKRLENIETPYTEISNIQAGLGYVVFAGGSSGVATEIVRLDLATCQIEVLRRSTELKLDQGYVSEPRSIEFPTGNGLTAYGIFYPPQNKDFGAPTGERPPLLVKSHGGPTAATSTSFNAEIQYWTSRGIAVLDVNYGGSSGYGRAYRQRLNGRWGIVDVDDCVNGARYLAAQGEVDGQRLAIDGGSAGGYTTLCALTFRDAFKAGASYFGVSDLEALAQDTHKFESRYLDNLIGPYPAQQALYYERSPIHFTEKLDCPLILFQGLEDKVVPPSQAVTMFEAVKAKGLPVAYLPFEGEQHGFRRAENIKRSLDAELYFYSKIFHFELADPIEPVQIENL